MLTNLMVAFCSSLILSKPASAAGMFFFRPSVLTAVTLYIFVVGLVYNFVLRFLWAPQGLQKVVDDILHKLIPLLFILYWLVFVPKKELQWQNVFVWLAFPVSYCMYVLFRGARTNLYPYPFMDVGVLGYKMVLINCGYLVIIFLSGALILVEIGKFAARNFNKSASS